MKSFAELTAMQGRRFFLFATANAANGARTLSAVDNRFCCLSVLSAPRQAASKLSLSTRSAFGSEHHSDFDLSRII